MNLRTGPTGDATASWLPTARLRAAVADEGLDCCPDCHLPRSEYEGHSCPANGYQWTPWTGRGPAEQLVSALAAAGRVEIARIGRVA